MLAVIMLLMPFFLSMLSKCFTG